MSRLLEQIKFIREINNRIRTLEEQRVQKLSALHTRYLADKRAIDIERKSYE